MTCHGFWKVPISTRPLDARLASTSPLTILRTVLLELPSKAHHASKQTVWLPKAHLVCWSAPASALMQCSK